MNSVLLASVWDNVFRVPGKFFVYVAVAAAFGVWTVVDTVALPVWFRRRVRGPAVAGIGRIVPLLPKPSAENIENDDIDDDASDDDVLEEDDLPFHLLQMRVEVPDCDPYNVSIRRRFFRWDRPVEGDALPVEVSTTNPRRIWIAPAATQMSE
jgi:hypothetical protein